jgi:hypothetical protein
MLRIKDHKQMELFDPWKFLSPKRRLLLDQSWPGLFKHAILSELPVRELASFFKSGFGRPTKELYTVLGTLVLQQTFDLTDEEAIDQLSFNIQWHYALNITEESDSAKYMCPKTLWSMRSIVTENGLEATLFQSGTANLSKIFNVNTDDQRIDSVHIKSNMRRLGRVGIFATGINKFLKNLKRQHKALFEELSITLIEKYLPEKSLACFSMVKPSKAQKTLTMVSDDLFDIVQQFKDQPLITGMHSYKLLERILKEHCNLTVSKDETKIEVKKPKEIPSDSLQNPSDPDATYSGHKGQGYQVQIMETYCKDEKTKEKTLNLITHVQVEQAHESDANALIPAIKSTQERGLGPKETLADSLYGSDDNCQEAEKFGVEIVAPTMGVQKKEDAIHLSDFNSTKGGKITSCPQGHTPVKVKKKKTRYTAAFSSENCYNCPNQTICPVKQGKKHHYLRYTKKEIRIAKRRAYEQTDEFKDRYRWRAGVEATMSEYDRRTGVKRLRVRGFKAVRYCATLKALGINLLRAAVIWMAINNDPKGSSRNESDCRHFFLVIKELFLIFCCYFKNFCSNWSHRYEHMPIMVAY